MNDQTIESNEQSLISTTCDEYSCSSKLIYHNRRLTPTTTRPTNLNRLSCIAENDYGIEQSRLYQINSSEDPSSILIPITLAIFVLIIVLSIVAVVCGCRTKQKRKRSSMNYLD